LRGFAKLLLLVLALFVGYTYWQVTRLQEDVGLLKARLGITSTQKPSAEETNVRRLIAQARESCHRASALLDGGHTKKAKREIGVCLQKLSKASKLAKSATGNKELSEAWEQVAGRLDKLWKQFGQEPQRKKGR